MQTNSMGMRAQSELCGWRLSSERDDDNGKPGKSRQKAAGVDQGDLPYRVELWDQGKSAVEQVLAVTANSSIGYAAFFEATREHPLRYVTLRHKENVLSRWNGPRGKGH